MKILSLYKVTTLLTLCFSVAACSNTPKKVTEPPPLGAAAAATASSAQIVETPRGPSLTLDDVLFDFEQSSLRPEATVTVAKAVNYLNSNPTHIALVEGHTDHTGPDSFNQQLSVQRSESIKNALIEQGISETRIKTKGLGESRPVANNETRDGRQANRRVEVIFVEN